MASSSKKVIYAALIGNALIAFTKFIALKEFLKTKGERGYIEAVHREKNPSVFIVLFEDSAALLGLLIAFIGILLGQLTGDARYDGLASILIGLVLGGTAIWLAYETKGLLVGESAQPEVLAFAVWPAGMQK